MKLRLLRKGNGGGKPSKGSEEMVFNIKTPAGTRVAVVLELEF